MTPNVTLLILIISIVSTAIGIVYFVSAQIKSLKKDSGEEKVLTEWLKEMKTSVDKSSETVERQLKDQRDSMDKQTKMIWERLDSAAKVISGVQSQLSGVQEFGKDMKDLSNILKSPKLRGGLGEQFLYEILENFLPKDMFKTQYRFRDGSICDAVILTDKGLIPIDSKFPMENFKLMLDSELPTDREKAKKDFVKDVKRRIDEIASKYILPDEGTTDQAVMYIPSENVYYELIVNTFEIEEYSKRKNVVLASPNTLSYFMKVILVAYQKGELQKHTGEILKALAGIKVEAEKFNEDLEVLDGHITRTSKSMDTVKTKYQKLFGKIDDIHAIGKEDSALLPTILPKDS